MIDDLSRYRWHTGARLRRLSPEERVPPLFRDVGVAPLATFLRGELHRLAGPMTPLTYMRSWRWEEPYVDHAGTGRLVVLDARALGVWHSGVPHVYVARSSRRSDAIAYVPGDLPLRDAARRLDGAKSAAEACEALGGRLHRARKQSDLAALARLAADEARAESVLGPLRRALQDGDHEARMRMERLDVDERDLCDAWHHLPAARRAHLASLADVSPVEAP